MTTLGWTYYYGEFGENPDYKNAYKWFKKASDAGDETSTTFIAYMSMDGIGTKQDREEARQLLEKMIEDGTADAYTYYTLGIIYEENLQVDKDLGKALLYFEKASDMGWDTASEKLGDMYLNGYDVEQDYSRALYYYKKAADNDSASPNVYKKLGDMYYYGLGVTINGNLALIYYVQAADKGLEDAELFGNMGRLYYWDADYSSSAVYFEKASDLGFDPMEMYNCGNAYYTLGDYSTALIWYGKALDYGFEKSEDLINDIENMVSEGKITAEEAAPYLN